MTKVDFNPKDYLDARGYANFYHIRARLREDRDHVNIIVGDEGEGKSMLGAIVDAVVDPTFCVKRKVFPTIELKWAISHSLCYQAIDQDEGAETWMSLDANTADGREMIRMFMEVRYKNLFFNIILPDVQLVQRYLKKHRAKTLLRVLRRGTYAFYSKNRVKQIKIDRTTQSVVWPRPNFIGYWKKLPNSSKFWNEYLRKARRFKSHKEEDPRVVEQQLKIEMFLQQTVTVRTASRMLGMKLHTLHTWVATGVLRKRFGIKVHNTPSGGKRLFVRDIKKMSKMLYGHALENLPEDMV